MPKLRSLLRVSLILVTLACLVPSSQAGDAPDSSIAWVTASDQGYPTSSTSLNGRSVCQLADGTIVSTGYMYGDTHRFEAYGFPPYIAGFLTEWEHDSGFPAGYIQRLDKDNGGIESLQEVRRKLNHSLYARSEAPEVVRPFVGGFLVGGTYSGPGCFEGWLDGDTTPGTCIDEEERGAFIARYFADGGFFTLDRLTHVPYDELPDGYSGGQSVRIRDVVSVTSGWDAGYVVSGDFTGSVVFHDQFEGGTYTFKSLHTHGFLARIGATGSIDWIRVIGPGETAAGGVGIARGLTKGPDGTIYTSGAWAGPCHVFDENGDVTHTLPTADGSRDLYGHSEWFLMRIDASNGEVLWSRTTRGGGGMGVAHSWTDDAPLATLPDGSCAAVGAFRATTSRDVVDLGHEDGTPIQLEPVGDGRFVAVFDPSGRVQWARTMGGENTTIPSVVAYDDGSVTVVGHTFRYTACATDGDDGIYVTDTNTNNHDTFIASFRNDGVLSRFQQLTDTYVREACKIDRTDLALVADYGTYLGSGTHEVRLTGDTEAYATLAGASGDFVARIDDLAVQPNQPPVAHAGADQGAIVGEVVSLDGSLSSDPDEGDTLTYAWSFVSRPADSTVSLTDADEVDPSFTPDVVGTYRIELRVTDPFGAESAPDTVDVVVVYRTQAILNSLMDVRTFIAGVPPIFLASDRHQSARETRTALLAQLDAIVAFIEGGIGERVDLAQAERDLLRLLSRTDGLARRGRVDKGPNLQRNGVDWILTAQTVAYQGLSSALTELRKQTPVDAARDRLLPALSYVRALSTAAFAGTADGNVAMARSQQRAAMQQQLESALALLDTTPFTSTEADQVAGLLSKLVMRTDGCFPGGRDYGLTTSRDALPRYWNSPASADWLRSRSHQFELLPLLTGAKDLMAAVE